MHLNSSTLLDNVKGNSYSLDMYVQLIFTGYMGELLYITYISRKFHGS